MMFGILPIDKPKTVNSRRVVDWVETAIGQKVGHAGTLDPLASGLLLTVIGPATRLVPYLQAMSKRYVARFQLGLSSDSIDTERDCQVVPIPENLTGEKLASVVAAFVGVIEQTPPPFSAVKVSGRRAYKLAQRGRSFELAPRRVTVFECRLSDVSFPEFEIDVRCGSGTYIRSMGRDIARQLGTECVMVDLRRTEIGPFRLEHCATVDQVHRGEIRTKIVDPLVAVSHLPQVILDHYDLQRLSRGFKFDFGQDFGSSELAVIDRENRLQAIMRPAPDGRWRPAVNFSVALAADNRYATPR
jgi:tRNA pseudouridine55 synthase